MFANMLTPWMIFGCFNLFLANVLIGWGEAFLVGRIFGTSTKANLGYMIAANYFSAVCGFVLLLAVGNHTFTFFSDEPPILQLPWLIPLLYLIAFALTIVLEWPFFFAVTPSGPRRFLRSVAITLLAQTASYAVLIPCYLLISTCSPMFGVTTTDDLSFVKEPKAAIFFIDAKDRSVWRINLDGTGKRQILNEDVQTSTLWAYWKPNGKLDLVAPQYPKDRVLIEDFAVNSFPDTNLEASNHGENQRWDRKIDLRPPWDRYWELRTADLGRRWISNTREARKSRPIKDVDLDVNTPFVSWYCHYTIFLPSGQVVFQLHDQILILDVETRQLGYITRGRGLVVVLKPLVGND